MIDTICIFIYLCLNRGCDFFTKVSHHWLFPTITGHGTENVLLMKFEILGLGVVIVVTTFLCFDDQWLLFSHTLCPSRKHVRSQSILLLCCIDSLTLENFQMALQTLAHWLCHLCLWIVLVLCTDPSYWCLATKVCIWWLFLMIIIYWALS